MVEGRYLRKEPEKKAGSSTIPYFVLGFIILGFVVLLIAGFVSVASSSGPLFGKCVAVVEIEGEISTASSEASLFSDGSYGSYQIAKKIESLNGREDVGAVLFIVNSPGGSVVAADEIYRAVKSLEKPKVAYFREMAASGGYYISAPADYIISEPNALTGSIGVIMSTYQVADLMDNLGIESKEIKSGEMKDIGSPFRNMTPEEEALLGEAVNETFKQFQSIIIENRGSKLNRELFNQALDGRVLTGRMALKTGLVDAVGSRDEAIMKAADLGGIEYGEVSDIPLCTVQTRPDPAGLFEMSSFIQKLTSGASGVSLEYR